MIDDGVRHSALKNNPSQAEKSFQEFYSTVQLARLAGISEAGVRRAAEKGLIKFLRLGPGGARIYHWREVEKFLKQRKRAPEAR